MFDGMMDSCGARSASMLIVVLMVGIVLVQTTGGDVGQGLILGFELLILMVLVIGFFMNVVPPLLGIYNHLKGWIDAKTNP